MTTDAQPSPPALPDTAALERLARELFGAFNTTEGTPATLGATAEAITLGLPATPPQPATAAPVIREAVASPGPPARGLTPSVEAPQVPVASQLEPELLGALKALESAPPMKPSAAPRATGTAPAPVNPVRPVCGLSLFEQIPPLSLEPGFDAAGGMPSLDGASESGFYFLDGAFGLPSGVTPPVAKTPPGGPRPSAAPPATRDVFDVATIRRDFPILDERVRGHRLIWLDNGATTQKPRVVIDRLAHYYERENSNIHRGAHTMAASATDAYESARESVRRFLNASSTSEIVFTRGATEAINLVAWSWGKQNLRSGDEIVLSWLEHHANIVPWHRLAQETGARLVIAPVDDRGELHVEDVQRLLGPRTRLVSFTQVSNALGTVTPAEAITEAAHRYGAKVLIDGAQAASHLTVDVQELDCDFYVFSGHKVFAPTGIGALFGKADALQGMPPWQGGGNMISDVTFERVTYQPPPGRFEAGTGSIGDAVALGTALDYVDRIGRERIAAHEHALIEHMLDGLRRIPGLRLIGTPRARAGIVSFVIDGYPTNEVGLALDSYGIAVRAGHHCAQPILRRFGVESTVRPSLAVYNTVDDVDALIEALRAITRGKGVGPVA